MSSRGEGVFPWVARPLAALLCCLLVSLPVMGSGGEDVESLDPLAVAKEQGELSLSQVLKLSLNHPSITREVERVSIAEKRQALSQPGWQETGVVLLGEPLYRGTEEGRLALEFSGRLPGKVEAGGRVYVDTLLRVFEDEKPEYAGAEVSLSRSFTLVETSVAASVGISLTEGGSESTSVSLTTLYPGSLPLDELAARREVLQAREELRNRLNQHLLGVVEAYAHLLEQRHYWLSARRALNTAMQELKSVEGRARAGGADDEELHRARLRAEDAKHAEEVAYSELLESGIELGEYLAMDTPSLSALLAAALRQEGAGEAVTEEELLWYEGEYLDPEPVLPAGANAERVDRDEWPSIWHGTLAGMIQGLSVEIAEANLGHARREAGPKAGLTLAHTSGESSKEIVDFSIRLPLYSLREDLALKQAEMAVEDARDAAQQAEERFVRQLDAQLQRLSAARFQMERAQSDLRYSEGRIGRLQKLYGKGHIAPAELEKGEQALLEARANWQQARLAYFREELVWHCLSGKQLGLDEAGNIVVRDPLGL